MRGDGRLLFVGGLILVLLLVEVQGDRAIHRNYESKEYRCIQEIDIYVYILLTLERVDDSPVVRGSVDCVVPFSGCNTLFATSL